MSDDYKWLACCQELLAASPDPSTKVGCIIIPQSFPPILGINDLPPLIYRDLVTMPQDQKYEIIVHAEMNALMQAAKFGYRVAGATMYMMAYDNVRGRFWGSAPCLGCAKHVITAGIKRVVSISPKPVTRWAETTDRAQLLLGEAGIQYEEVDCG